MRNLPAIFHWAYLDFLKVEQLIWKSEYSWGEEGDVDVISPALLHSGCFNGLRSSRGSLSASCDILVKCKEYDYRILTMR
jgi:hypothetical protein